MAAHHEQAREITERIHISGVLQLVSPAHFGNGAVRGNAMVDMSLLLDELDSSALIPGTTIAGALRNHLRERMGGYSTEHQDELAKIQQLFGPLRTSAGNDTAEQSLLIIDDAHAINWSTTLRDGVRIDPENSLAYVDPQTKAGAKFDVELLEAGTVFDLHLELLGTKSTSVEELLPYVVWALEGLENSEIRLGLRKRRGFGRCRVKEWRVSRYDLRNPQQLCAWLSTPSFTHYDNPARGTIRQTLEFSKIPEEDARKRLVVHVEFGLDRSSLLIRSGFGKADIGPDVEHLHALDADGQNRPAIPGTSWAGVLRHRGLRIANTIAASGNHSNSAAGDDFVKGLFGWIPGEQTSDIGSASKITIDESVVCNGHSLYQTRVRIDRFTGGALETALFEEVPVYGTSMTKVNLDYSVRNPSDAEVGLLMLLLKDLWTSDLPVGGEASVGRGRLVGMSAQITLPDGQMVHLKADTAELGLASEQQRTLQKNVDALWHQLGGAKEKAQHD